jgi:hypothetical protein
MPKAFPPEFRRDVVAVARSFRLRVVSSLDGELVIDGPEHAVDGEATLCELPRADIDVMRHHCYADSGFACANCAAGRTRLNRA